MKEKSAVGAGEGGRVTVSSFCTSENVPSTNTMSPSLPPPPLPPRLRISDLAPFRTAPSSLLMRGGCLGVGVFGDGDRFLWLLLDVAESVFKVGLRYGYASESEAERKFLVGSFGRTGVPLERDRLPNDAVKRGLGEDGPGKD